ncbi:MAG: STAS domain-containing protein [Candidatus Eremiobacteraeota bacterium]|nr:STAS domain-containing protein [Candidatus Eremiobacteraeota bacterium]
MFNYRPITVTSFAEPFDELAANRVRSQFREHVKFGHRLHVIDLDQLDAPNVLMLRSLIVARRTARAAGGDVRLVNSRPGMRRLLALTGLSRVFPVHSRVIDAVRAFREQPRVAS